MPLLSKPKMSRSTVENRYSVGRVFCVTGMKNQSARNRESDRPAAATEQNLKSTFLMESDGDSNSSGYMSSSSFETSEEDKRFDLNEQKVFDVWGKNIERVQIPKTSTPIQASEKAVLRKRRVILSCESGKHMLAIKKNFNVKSMEKSNTNAELKDSFCDTPTVGVPRSNSEDDLRRSRDDGNTSNQHKRSSVPSCDAVLDINGRKQTESQNWKRKPFIPISDSQLQIRMCANDGRSSDYVRNISSSSYSVLPRYRVKVDSDPIVSQTKLTQHLSMSKSCAGIMDDGVPVDESISEFLANVDRENLAGFLSFYDKMTSGDAHEKVRRNMFNYEVLYC